MFCNGLKINLIRKNSMSKTEDEVSVNSRIINHLQNTRQGGIRRRKVRGITAEGLHTGKQIVSGMAAELHTGVEG